MERIPELTLSAAAAPGAISNEEVERVIEEMSPTRRRTRSATALIRGGNYFDIRVPLYPNSSLIFLGEAHTNDSIRSSNSSDEDEREDQEERGRIEENNYCTEFSANVQEDQKNIQNPIQQNYFT